MINISNKFIVFFLLLTSVSCVDKEIEDAKTLYNQQLYVFINGRLEIQSILEGDDYYEEYSRWKSSVQLLNSDDTISYAPEIVISSVLEKVNFQERGVVIYQKRKASNHNWTQFTWTANSSDKKFINYLKLLALKAKKKKMELEENESIKTDNI